MQKIHMCKHLKNTVELVTKAIIVHLMGDIMI